jgi:anthranilate/para-aminobenzoate synthase component I
VSTTRNDGAHERRRAAAIAAIAAQDRAGFAWFDGGADARGFLGIDADLVLEGDDAALFAAADDAWRAAPEHVWLGWISYDFAADLVLGRSPRPRALPGVVLRRYLGALELAPGFGVRGHGDAECWRALADAVADGAPGLPAASTWPMSPLSSTVDPEAYRERVRAAKREIVAGETYQVNLAQRFVATWNAETRARSLAERAAALYLRVRERAPAEMGALVRGANGWVISNSPETLLDVRRGAGPHGSDIATSVPIKGTRPRGATPAADAAMRAELRASVKDRAEHVMIVDLVRNDLGRIALAGTVCAPSEPSELALPTVHHLVTEVRAQLRPGIGLSEMVAALVPGGSVTGAPKRRTLEIIEALEGEDRGIYCGALLVLEPGGLRMSIPIRTGWLDEAGLSLHAGGGIVVDSDPEGERVETIAKTLAFS